MKLKKRWTEIEKLSFHLSIDDQKNEAENLLASIENNDDREVWINQVIEARKLLNTLLSKICEHFSKISKLNATKGVLDHFYPKLKVSL